MQHSKNIFFVASWQKKAHICLPRQCVLFSTKFALRASEIALLWNICSANVKYSLRECGQISFHIERSEIFHNFRKEIISHFAARQNISPNTETNSCILFGTTTQKNSLHRRYEGFFVIRTQIAFSDWKRIERWRFFNRNRHFIGFRCVFFRIVL